MNGEKSPPVTETSSFLMLPNDLLFNCLARVSRLYYPRLSLVSKRFRSLLVSLELYQTRTLLGRMESCLYVGLMFPSASYQTRWFTLSRRQTHSPNPRWFTPMLAPYRFLMNCNRKKENNNILLSIPNSACPSMGSWSFTKVGCKIYKIGRRKSSSSVLFFDCRSHTWHEAPSMQVARNFPHVTVLDGKIYVVGGNIKCDSSNWIEFFDPKTQIWDYVPSKIGRRCVSQILAIDGNLYLFGMYGDKNVVYKPKENRWDDVDDVIEKFSWFKDCSCVIDNILYTYRWKGKLKWYDFKERCWRVLKGLKNLPDLPYNCDCVRLVNYRGKIAVLWEKDDDDVVVVVGDEKKEIWCAEIALERRNENEIRGKIEWCNVVLKVPKSCCFLHFFAVTV